MIEPSKTNRPVVWAMGILMVVLTVNWVAAVARFQVEGIFWDQWVYCQPFFREEWTWLDLFMQQLGPHRQGVAFVLTAPLMTLADWDTRIEGLWIVFWLVVAAGLALAWKQRLTGRLGWEDLWLAAGAVERAPIRNRHRGPESVAQRVSPGAVDGHGVDRGRADVPGAVGGVRHLGRVGHVHGIWAFRVGRGGLDGALRVLRAWWRRDLGTVGGRPPPGWCWSCLGRFPAGLPPPQRQRGIGVPAFAPVRLPAVCRPHAGVADGSGGRGRWAWRWAGGVLVLGVGTFWIRELAAVARPGGFAGLDGRGAPGRDRLELRFFTALGRLHLGSGRGCAALCDLGGRDLAGVRGGGSGGPMSRVGRAAAGLGWASVVMSWVDLPRRPLASWPGMLGMSEVSYNGIAFSNRQKMEWLLAWEETGDWRAAETQRPRGIFGEAESLRLGERMDWLAARGLTFADPANEPLAWLPWWNPLGYTWIKGLGGEHQQWMAEEAVLLVEGRESGYVNLQFGARAPALPPEGKVVIAWGDLRTTVEAQVMLAGVSLPAPTDRTKLVIRSTAGAVPLHPPLDPRRTSYLVFDPTVTAAPQFEVKWWSEEGAGWWDDHSFEVVSGRWNWEEENGERFVWTDAQLVLRSRARGPTYWNIEIESRYEPVDHGPVTVKWGGRALTLPWDEGGLRFSVPMRGGAQHQLEIGNRAGASSPQAQGESSDARNLALRLRRLELSRDATFPVLEHGDDT